MNSINIDEQFFGRQSSLELLERRILDLKDGYRQNVALLGNKYVGKSSLFYRFLTRFDDPDVTTIYLDLENKDFNYFFHKFVTTLLYNFSKSQHLPLHEDLNLLLESVKSRIPHTVQVIRKIQAAFEGKKLADCFLGLLTLPEIFTNESGKFCVLILDEFQNIEDYPIPNIFQELGKKIMTQKRCLYIVASSYPSLAKKILAEKLSLLFGNFEIVDVEPFDHESSQKFIEQSIKEHNIGMHLRNFLTDFTGGYPLYLSLICRELNNLSAIYKQSEIYMPLLSQAVENTIFDKWGVISRHFELIINDLCNGKGNRIISSLLIAVSNGKHKLEDVVDEVGGTKHQVRQKLNR
ncbi:MAG: ATP-binding protein, partial [Candidatus Omnitrophica bacterium]|nr:ATP-binding protein [Candidatus Omnitrophota bacterium]